VLTRPPPTPAACPCEVIKTDEGTGLQDRCGGLSTTQDVVTQSAQTTIFVVVVEFLMNPFRDYM